VAENGGPGDIFGIFSTRAQPARLVVLTFF